ncbi:hypothetical protein ACQP2E_27380 [Actinoplanes sp. CA-015351]|uniref:hypothetical protein n=1 Tax=Actinoplanes sp. CA-015351 TaxID=3239897 RepID=UPI003D99B540
MPDDDSAAVGRLLDRLGCQPSSDLWEELEGLLSLDFTDEHYHVGCPHSSTRLAIVIGEHGHYSAFRHYNDGDIHRIPLKPAMPDELTGIGRWMHDTAAAGGDMLLAEGLAYLFGQATCGLCGSTFNLADWFEAENSPHQPIDPIVISSMAAASG